MSTESSFGVSERPSGRPSLRELAALAGSDLEPTGGAALFHHLGLVSGLRQASEVVSAGCGAGLGLQYLVETFGVHGSGVDADAQMVSRAEERVRTAELTERLRVQAAPMDALPYRDGIFDVGLGELGLTSGADADEAVAELVRVTRPGGTVVLLQVAWTAPVALDKQRRIARALGFEPRPLIEWKRLLSGHAVGDLYAEDWSEGSNALRSVSAAPLPGVVDGFSFRDRIDVTRRAWKRWGLRGAVEVWGEGGLLQRVLQRERPLSLVLLKGVRQAAELRGVEAEKAEDGPPPIEIRPSDVSDLPLFGSSAREAS